MVTKDFLFLHEQIMLLALRDKEGTIATSTMYKYAISGAILAELILNNRIVVDESKKRKLIRVLDSTPVGEPLIDECFDKIKNANRNQSLQTWVSRFSSVKNLKHRVAKHLCQRGILRVDESKILLIFNRTIYPEVNPEPERKLIEQLREAIFSNTERIDPRTVVLISLCNGTEILKAIFDRKTLKVRKDRINQIINGELTGKAVKEVRDAMQAAVMVTCILPAIVSTTVSH